MDQTVEIGVLKQLGEINGSVGELKGLVVGISNSLQAGATRMDNHETRIRELERTVARYSAYAAIAAIIGSVVVQQITSRLL